MTVMNALRIIEWVLLAALLAFSLSGCGRVKEELALLPADNFGGETPEADFSVFTNVDISGVDLESLNEEQLSVLVTQARYCQAMTEANLDTLREIVSEDMTFTHMSGLKQTREEYFADIADGSLDYHRIGIEKPVIGIEEKRAIITYTSVLNANAYGAEGTYRMYGKHCYELREGAWVAVNR
ncbi:MAG: nuclear transport factor 2 family protein [Oscillospiraceae bacterium]|nr:nuclear transport factor 2 family protein [Oscillospiraceae bacterium]